MAELSGDFARRDSAGPCGGSPGCRWDARVPPPPPGDGAGSRNHGPGGDDRAARRSAPHRGPRRAVVDPARGGGSDPGRAAMTEGDEERAGDPRTSSRGNPRGMTQASCHGPAVLHDPVPTRPQLVLAGNPNVGKTTLFNALTGSSAKVSNYPGITVEVAI